MTIARPAPYQMHVVIPNEILASIAEHCIGPYSIRAVDGKLLAIQSPETQPGFPQTLAVSSLKTVSIVFQAGIEKGLRTNFSGHLTLPLREADTVNIFLGTKGVLWVINATTHITLTKVLSLQHQTASLSMYPKLKHVNIVTIAVIKDGDTSFMHQPNFYKSDLVSVLGPPNTSGVMLPELTKPTMLLKLIFCQDGSGVVFKCHNVEIQVCGFEQRLIKRYDSEEIDDCVRSDLDQGSRLTN